MSMIFSTLFPFASRVFIEIPIDKKKMRYLQYQAAGEISIKQL